MFPYCIISTHLSILSITFHAIFIMLTTCIEIQKVIAMKFPIWTKIHLTKSKTVICCIACFIVAISVGFPRHFAIGFISVNYDWSKKGVSVIRVDVGPISETVYIDIILNTIIERLEKYLMISLCPLLLSNVNGGGSN